MGEWKERAMRGWGRLMVAAAVAAVGLLVPAAGQAGGGAPALAWSPSTSGAYDYGTLDAGAGATKSVNFTLTNSGGMAAGTLKVTLSGSSAFTLTTDGCTGRSLGPKKTCGVTVQYAPASAGQSDSATLAATGEHASASLSLTGASGTPDLTLSPGTLLGTTDSGTKDYDFANGFAAGSWTQTFTVTNDGTGTSNTLSLNGCCQTSFTLSNDQTSGHTLAPGGTSTFDLTFTAPAGCNPGDEFHTPLAVNLQDNGAPYIFLVAHGFCPPS
jgi:hypothetical protein